MYLPDWKWIPIRKGLLLMSNKVIFNLDELFISVGIDVGADFSWMSIGTSKPTIRRKTLQNPT